MRFNTNYSMTNLFILVHQTPDWTSFFLTKLFYYFCIFNKALIEPYSICLWGEFSEILLFLPCLRREDFILLLVWGLRDCCFVPFSTFPTAATEFFQLFLVVTRIDSFLFWGVVWNDLAPYSFASTSFCCTKLLLRTKVFKVGRSGYRFCWWNWPTVPDSLTSVVCASDYWVGRERTFLEMLSFDAGPLG